MAKHQSVSPGAETRGYHKLADLMGPYQEVAIFRRFGPLNMLNLLSLQAELVELDAEFRDIWREDDTSSDPGRRDFAVYFQKLRDSEAGLYRHQFEKLLEIRQKLHEYNAALLEASQVANLATPDPRDVNFLRAWLDGEREGNGFLQGSEAFTWDLPHASRKQRKQFERDLIVLSTSSKEHDPFSRQLTTRLLAWYHYLWGSRSSRRKRDKTIDPYSGVMYYDEHTLLRLNTIVVSVISSALPVVSMFVLYFIKTLTGRLGATVAFTSTFAFALAMFTNARRLEIFASTSALIRLGLIQYRLC